MNLVGLIVQCFVFVSVLALVFLTDFAENTGKFTPPPHPVSVPHHHFHEKHHIEPRQNNKLETRGADFTWDISGFFTDRNLIPRNDV